MEYLAQAGTPESGPHRGRTFFFDVANCDIKHGAGWTPDAALGFHRARRCHEVSLDEVERVVI